MAAIDPELRAPLEWIFDSILDEDKSGFIEKTEGLMVAKYLGSKDIGKDEFWANWVKEVDTDGDGKVSKEEFVTWMANTQTKYPATALQLKQEMTMKKAQHDHLRAAVANEDFGLDDMEEVGLDGEAAPPKPTEPAAAAAAKAPVLDLAKKDALAAKFKEADADGNGQLSKDELADLLLGIDDAVIDDLWKQADVDGDGKVTFDEFIKAADAIEAAEAAANDDLAGDLGL